MTLLKSYDQQMKDAGCVLCDKHLKWFDPTKFTACYYCHLQEKFGEDWKKHIGEKTPMTGNKEGFESPKDWQESTEGEPAHET